MYQVRHFRSGVQHRTLLVFPVFYSHKVKGDRTNLRRRLLQSAKQLRYMRRDIKVQFKEGDDVGRSLGKDVKQAAKRKIRSGHGNKGDRVRA